MWIKSQSKASFLSTAEHHRQATSNFSTFSASLSAAFSSEGLRTGLFFASSPFQGGGKFRIFLNLPLIQNSFCPQNEITNSKFASFLSVNLFTCKPTISPAGFAKLVTYLQVGKKTSSVGVHPRLLWWGACWRLYAWVLVLCCIQVSASRDRVHNMGTLKRLIYPGLQVCDGRWPARHFQHCILPLLWDHWAGSQVDSLHYFLHVHFLFAGRLF